MLELVKQYHADQVGNIDTVMDYIKAFSEGDKFLILVKLDKPENITITEFLSIYSSQGYKWKRWKYLLIEDVKIFHIKIFI